MKKARTIELIGVVMLGLMLGGCSINLGNSSPPPGSGATLGQELVDLKQAFDTGVITEQEYLVQKERLLEKKGRH